ncbi:hypothetical protein [Ralstonia solanacearum]|uniref:Uncharacterized protein n=1 Tax=Ralstonia solanacearum TaxID=305 RepID=A0AAE3NNS6_RALSL|nr:hypothetical protein [Ralstonia solanacearum]MBB6581659.1 hypothetical protein [Ralstonia solanacearum]MDB0523761.1 hypothetical protein [Ralstonia solanacearum]
MNRGRTILCAGIVLLIASPAFAFDIGPVHLNNLPNPFPNHIPTVQEILDAGNDAVGKTVATVVSIGGHTVNTVVDEQKRVTATVFTAAGDVYATYTKSLRDIGREQEKAWNEGVDAARASEHFAEHQLKDTSKRAEKVGRQITQGRLIDAGWEWSVGGYHDSEKNFFVATQESQVIAQAASTAAATYGGPAGAAAYAAWATYRATGDANMAFKAGMLAAASSQAGKVTSSMPTGTMGQVVEKAAVAGAAGGIAVAAAGGDEGAIKDAFLKSGGQVIVQAGTDAARGYSPNMVETAQVLQCISARDIDCVSKTRYVTKHGRLEAGEYLKRLQHQLDPQDMVGHWTSIAYASAAEAKKYEAVLDISKLPGKEQIPLINNRWILTYSFGKDITYGKPAVVLTEVGRDPPFAFATKYSRTSTEAHNLGAQVRSLRVAKQAGRTSITYVCPFNDFNRIVSASPYGAGCQAVYQKERGVEQTILRTDLSRYECVKRATLFVRTNLKPLKCRVDA